MTIRIVITSLLIMASTFVSAQVTERHFGPVIKNYGAVFNVDNPDYQLDTNKTYKVVFDIMSSPTDPTKLNPSINTIARFLNMHAQAGIPAKNLQVACVFHNKATKDAITDEAYTDRHQTANPNLELIRELSNAGVEMYICGQSIQARGVNTIDLAEPIQIALSAMTILIDYQQDGYQLIKF